MGSDDSVFLVGHPGAGLKKFSSGTVRDITGDWLTYDGFSIGGNSGSPLLNSDGAVVGIHHRSYDGKVLLTREHIASDGIATSSRLLRESLGGSDLNLTSDNLKNEPSLELNLSSLDNLTWEDLIDKGRAALFWNSGKFPDLPATESPQGDEASATDATTRYMNHYQAKCREALANPANKAAPDLANEIKSTCLRVSRFLHCQTDSKSRRPFQACSNDDEIAETKQLARMASDQIRALNQSGYMGSLAELEYRLAPDRKTGREYAWSAIHAARERQGRAVNLRLAALYIYNTHSSDQLQVAGMNLENFIKAYPAHIKRATDPYYAIDAAFVLYSWGDDFMTRAELVGLVEHALTDKATPLGVWLDIEAWAYQMNMLP